jgi:hypothetical protein
MASSPLSFRDRLLLFFADLRTHGVEACVAERRAVDEARVALALELAEKHPDGLGSYVFWIQRDEVQFDAQGDLPAGESLVLYHSGAEVADAVEAIGARFGIRAVEHAVSSVRVVDATR